VNDNRNPLAEKEQIMRGYKTYHIAIQKPFIQNQFVPVLGKPVKLKGFEDFQFFAYKNGKYWRICESTTGLLVFLGSKTLAETIANTEAKLDLYKVTKTSMADVIRLSKKAPTENNIT
jgi:hypothetical protein